MPRNMFTGIVLAVTVLLLMSPIQAQQGSQSKTVSAQNEITALQEQSDQAYQAEKWVVFYVANMKLNKLRPYEPEYLVNIIRACALLDRKSTAYHYMLLMQKQGLSYDFDSSEDTLNIRETEAYEYINSMLVDAGKPSGTGISAFTVPGAPADFGAITWDASRDRFLLGTRNEGKVVAVSADGEAEVLLEANEENGLWSINGLAVDAERNRLWISSAAIPEFYGFTEADRNRGALFEFDLETLERLGRYEPTADGLDHELGSLALTADGLVYVIDRATPMVYVKAPAGDRLAGYFTSADLQALRDIAVVPDNSRIFIADTYRGVMTIDPIGEQAALLAGPETMNLGGIEAIEFRDGNLFIVQGALDPQRVLRLELDPGGAVVENVSPMAIALDNFSQPGMGTIQGENLYYIANTGALEAAAAVIMSTPLDAGTPVAPPDLTQFGEAIKAQSQ